MPAVFNPNEPFVEESAIPSFDPAQPFEEEQPLFEPPGEILRQFKAAENPQRIGPGGYPSDPGTELTTAIGESVGRAPGYVMDVARSIPADVAAFGSMFERPQNVSTTLFPSPSNIKKAVAQNLPYVASAAGNVPAALRGEPLPIDPVIAEAAKESLPVATTARLSQDLAATAPLAVVGLLPATAARLVTAGFTVDMLRHAPELFNQYAEEINKPESEQNPDKLATLQSGILQTFTMAPLAGAHGFGKPVAETVAQARTAFDNAKRLIPTTKGAPYAETIRGNQGQLLEVGKVPEESQEARRDDLQQAAPVQSEPVAERVEPPVTPPEVARGNQAPQPIISGEQGTTPAPPGVLGTGEQPAPVSPEPKIFGYTWDQIKSAQQGERLSEAIKGSATRPQAKPSDYKALEEHGLEWLQDNEMFGILDRLGLPMKHRAAEPSTPPPTPQPESPAGALGTEQPNVIPPVTETQLSRGPGAAASGEPGTYSAIAQLADRIEATAKQNDPVSRKIGAIEKAKVMAADLKDGVKSGLANVLAIKKALWDSYAGLAPYTEMKKIVGEWFHANQKADFEAREFGRQIIKAVPDKLRREAITNWIQADGDVAVLKQRAEASRGSLKHGYELAQSLTPRETEIAQMLREYYDQQLERGVSEGLLKDGLENYITQIWKRENPITRKLQNDLVNSRLQPNFRFAKQRIFESFFEGEQAGYKPMKDAGALVANYDQAFNKALAARAFIKQLHEGTASDGRPLVEVSGSGKLVGEEEPKPKFIIRPKSTPEAIGDYKTIDHPALRGWKWVGKTPEGTDVLMQGELKVHPEIYAKLKNRLSTSWFRQHPASRAVLNVQSTLKQSMLSVSMFHQVQEGLHALGHRVNPMNLEKLDFSEPVTKSLVEHGLQLADHNALEQFGEGLSSGNLLNKIPALGPKLKQYNDWLFQEHIPRLKLTMAKHALERNMERYADSIKSGKISADQVLELTASQANHAFGELPYKYWGRNPNLQDFYRTFLLAPDFLEARAGFVGQALKPGGLGAKGLLKNEQMQALALLALTQYITARVSNQIIDQDPHWELKNAFRIISGGHAYSLRTIPGDVIHLMSDPRGFTYNRLSPVVGRGSIELVTGRDYRGVKRDFIEQMEDVLKSGIPISLQRKNGSTILESFGNAMGFQSQRYDAVQNMQQKIADFKFAQGIKEPYETIYSQEDDQYAALRLAIQSGRQSVAQAEFDKLKRTVKPEKIREHFKLSWSRPLTGSKANDLKFYKTLNEVGRMEWKEAQDLRKARIQAINSLR